MNTRAMGVGFDRPPPSADARPPVLLKRVYINLAAAEFSLITEVKRDIQMIIVNVTDGVLDMWLGNQTVNGSGSPDWRFTPQGPKELWLPPNDYEFTVVGNLATNRGVVMLLG